MNAKSTLSLAAVFVAILAAAAFDTSIPTDDSAEARYAKEIPTVDLPRELREQNWGGGSCVHPRQ